jgi:hypothetical protein
VDHPDGVTSPAMTVGHDVTVIAMSTHDEQR